MKFKKKKIFFFFFLGRLHFSLGPFKGEISAPRETISPQSPSSLFPAMLSKKLVILAVHILTLLFNRTETVWWTTAWLGGQGPCRHGTLRRPDPQELV